MQLSKGNIIGVGVFEKWSLSANNRNCLIKPLKVNDFSAIDMTFQKTQGVENSINWGLISVKLNLRFNTHSVPFSQRIQKT